MKTIRLGIIGAGANTRKMHLPQFQNIPGVALSEVANRTEESASKVAAEFNIPTVRNHWQEVATSPDVDAVVIGAWPNLHCEATCLALEHGKHVLTEARMARDASEARKMLTWSRKFSDQVTQVVPSPFTLHADKTIQSCIEKGELGQIQSFFFEFSSQPTTPQNAPLHWRRNRDLSGLNTMTLGIAYESILRWLGPAHHVSASGAIINNQAIHPESREKVAVEIPDSLSVNVAMTGGLNGTLIFSETGETGRPSCFYLQGNKAALKIPFQVEGELEVGTADNCAFQWTPYPIPDTIKGGWRVEEEFIEAIRQNEKIKYTSFETGVDYMVFTEAVHRSYRMEGIPVFLSDI